MINECTRRTYVPAAAADSPNAGVPAEEAKTARSKIRQQYTLKGIESETLDLVRQAAEHEGMRINAWVSSKMRTAAEAVLDEDNEPDMDQVICGPGFGSTEKDGWVNVLERLRTLEQDMQNVMRVQQTLVIGMMSEKQSL